MIFKSKRLTTIIVATAILLIIPLIAMQFTNEVNWKLSDFVVAGVLLFGTGLTYDLVMRKIPNAIHRIFIIVGLLIFLMLLWAELAVGIFGTPFSGN